MEEDRYGITIFEGPTHRQAVKFSFFILNNEVKYEVVLLDLQVAKALSVTSLELRCDSQFMASQIRGEYEEKNKGIAQYLALTCSLAIRFTNFVVAQVMRSKNIMLDALANIASNALYPCHVELSVLSYSSISAEVTLIAETRTSDSWMLPISNYLKNGVLLMERKVAERTKARATRYALINDVLYHRSFSFLYQRSVPPDET